MKVLPRDKLCTLDRRQTRSRARPSSSRLSTNGRRYKDGIHKGEAGRSEPCSQATASSASRGQGRNTGGYSTRQRPMRGRSAAYGNRGGVRGEERKKMEQERNRERCRRQDAGVDERWYSWWCCGRKTCMYREQGWEGMGHNWHRFESAD
ncbi:hypothetical protein BD414DRAFT_304643 [Trametes punicea]|nr:hypothetical protein BD414DRAFT_304643 [Trametes punicea]